MKGANNKAKLNRQSNSYSHYHTKHHSKIQPRKQVSECVQQLNNSPTTNQRRQALIQIITLCFSNWTNQFYLCNNLGIPFREGPIAITSIPDLFRQKTHEIARLFKYLTKVRESYICWVIYLDNELGILNLKLLTQYQISSIYKFLVNNQIIVGIFIGKQYFQKTQLLNIKTDCQQENVNSELQGKQKQWKKQNRNMKQLNIKQCKQVKNNYIQKYCKNSHHKRQNISTSNIKIQNGNKNKVQKNNKCYHFKSTHLQKNSKSFN